MKQELKHEKGHLDIEACAKNLNLNGSQKSLNWGFQILKKEFYLMKEKGNYPTFSHYFVVKNFPLFCRQNLSSKHFLFGNIDCCQTDKIIIFTLTYYLICYFYDQLSALNQDVFRRSSSQAQSRQQLKCIEPRLTTLGKLTKELVRHSISLREKPHCLFKFTTALYYVHTMVS